jgi:branched-chain amino acid aminotransferase
MLVNYNGIFVPETKAVLAVNDGAVLFGDSLFETLKARRKTICHLERHLDRMEQSARLLVMPFDRRQVTAALLAIAERLDAPVSRLRLTLSRGPFTGLTFPAQEQRHFFITAQPYSEPTAQERRRGVNCVFAPNQRVNPLSHLPQMKRGNYIDCLYAADFARRQGAREALFVGVQGEILEGATSNLFLRQGETLITPTAGPLVLGGIMRHRIIRTAQALGLSVVEKNVSKMELLAAEEVFLCNALIDILPVSAIENLPIATGPVAGILLEQLQRQTE